MIYSYILIIAAIIIVFIIFKLFTIRKKTAVKTGLVSGFVMNKITKMGAENVEVSLGRLVSEGTGHTFIKVNKMNTKTKENGYFEILNVEIQSYWIMAEYNGKKALKMIKLTEYNSNVENITLLV